MTTSSGSGPELPEPAPVPAAAAEPVRFELDGSPVEVPDDGRTLLDALRESLGVTSVKDGCSPQGQCGCCTVMVDGQPRVACVTPARRVRGRDVRTLDGLPDGAAVAWADALCATGGSQCGFCTPGIIVRLEGLRSRRPDADRVNVDRALAAHLCRCTGWQTIHEAWDLVTGAVTASATVVGDLTGSASPPAAGSERDFAAAARRAEIEGGAPQQVGPDVALGRGGFAADTAPDDALVALRGPDGEWIVAETLDEARAASGKVQGRRTTLDATPPIALPDGDWDVTLQTNWVEPGYLETDASWCAPGGEPATELANGGAFGAKRSSIAGREARRLADLHGRAVRVLLSREDTVTLGPKRPPLAGGARADGSGVIHVARTPGIAARIADAVPGFDVVEVDVPGPPTSADIRGAGWAEALVLARAATGESGPVHGPGGGTATASVVDDRIVVTVDAGEALDDVVLRSYVIGAAHMAWSLVTSEALTVDAQGHVHDLTIRSFGIVKSSDMPPVDVTTTSPGTSPGAQPAGGDPPRAVSDAVFVAVASAVWRWAGHGPVWPTGRPLTSSP